MLKEAYHGSAVCSQIVWAGALGCSGVSELPMLVDVLLPTLRFFF